MAGTGDIRDLILAAVEGATGGVSALRAAGIPAALGSFSAEIDYDGSAPGGQEVGALVRLSIVAGNGEPAARRPAPGPGADHPPTGNRPRGAGLQSVGEGDDVI